MFLYIIVLNYVVLYSERLKICYNYLYLNKYMVLSVQIWG